MRIKEIEDRGFELEGKMLKVSFEYRGEQIEFRVRKSISDEMLAWAIEHEKRKVDDKLGK